ncbi:hypothetical protein PRJ_4648 [Pseudomonas sp. XWY-1]|nr:hypothetical protein PRJ_4648 [Pseudomonas sp. XWY-1]
MLIHNHLVMYEVVDFNIHRARPAGNCKSACHAQAFSQFQERKPACPPRTTAAS